MLLYHNFHKYSRKKYRLVLCILTKNIRKRMDSSGYQYSSGCFRALLKNNDLYSIHYYNWPTALLTYLYYTKQNV